MPIHKDIQVYNATQSAGDKRICDALAKPIDRHLPNAQSKVWHGHPVWFLDGYLITMWCNTRPERRIERVPSISLLET